MPVSALFTLLLMLAALWLPAGVRAQTYSSASEPFGWVSTSGHSNVSWGGGCTGGWASVDDDISAELALGFTFTFGSTSYTTVRVMSNGRLQFNNRYCGNGTQNTSPRTYPLAYPNSNLSRTMRIYGADFDPAIGGSVTYKSLGTAPNRSFVVTWTNIREWSASGSSFNLQVILYENGDWVYQFGSISNTSGGKAQIGWQLSTTDYATFGFTSIGSLANTAVRWRRPQSTISGTVFEDLNYGGGAGRAMSSSGGAAVSGATVELYNSSGSFVSSTTSNGSGAFSFTVTTAGNYHVRVASTTVSSTRSGSSSSLRGVLTYRTTATTGSAVAVTDFVGGTSPGSADPGAGSSGTTFNTSSYAFTAGLSGTAHAVAPVTVTLGSNVSGIDFGFNFATVSNVNDSGQGSLRQAITNANTLSGDASLAQSGRTAGVENLIFMIGNGSAAAGLRSSINLTTSGVATIAVASALPSITQTLIVDAGTQPGFTSTPVVEINGAATAAGMAGLVVAASHCTIEGLAINRFGGNGITLGSGTSGQAVRGNHIGTNAAGSSALANGGHGVEVRSSSSTIGGSISGDGNLLAGNAGSGVYVAASGTTITGNKIGSNVTGSAALANQYGIRAATSTTLTVGGTSGTAGNTIAGNGSHGIYFESGNTGATVQGNRIGRNAADSGALANGGSGIYVGGSAMTAGLTGGTIGGTASGAGNTIAHNGASGIALAAGQASEVAILGNSIYGHTGPGIDLGADGISTNDGATSGTQPNRMTDAPVFTAASFSGATLTVTGYVGSASGQSAFAGARVEIFVSDESLASGSGQTYVGSLTTDASGNFSGGVTIPGSVTLTHGSTRLTATATDTGNRSSEFGPNRLLGLGIAGTVFEDLHYGGGAGRSKADAGGVAVAAARVELYDSSGAYVSATTSAADGSYSFTGLAPGAYHLRVVSGTVLSTRSGSMSSLVGVMTYRTDATTGNAVAVSDFVGGTDPSAADPGNGGSGTSLNTTSHVFSAGLSGTAHAVAPATLASADIGGVDFGFNFDAITNTNDSGQGSLRQAITNAQTLAGDNALAQTGKSAGIEHLVFMLGNGTSAAGLRSTINRFSGGVATLAPTSALPAITTTLVIDAQTQPGWSANPIVEVNGTGIGSGSPCFAASAGTLTLRGFVINRCPGDAVSSSGGSNHVLQGNWIGLASSGSAASALAGTSSSGVRLADTSGVLIGGSSSAQRNVISGNRYVGIYLSSNVTSLTVSGNHIGTNAAGNAAVANAVGGIRWGSGISGTSGITIGGAGAGNLISGNTGSGIRVTDGAPVISGNFIGVNAAGSAALANSGHGITLESSTGAATIGGASGTLRNIVSGNGDDGIHIELASAATTSGIVIAGNFVGVAGDGSTTLANASDGIDVQLGSGITIGGTVGAIGNVIAGNGANGIEVEGASQAVAILGNSIHGNGRRGIDLANNGVSLNDGAKTAGAPNLLMDHPVITRARLTGTSLAIAGYVGSAAGQSTFAGNRIELFVADNDGSGHGEGKTHLGTLTADASGNFSGTLGLASTLTMGTQLTATATDGANNTSEFGVRYAGLSVDFVVNSTADGADAAPGDGLCQAASGLCTLRAAIDELNAWPSQATAPTIAFALPGCASNGDSACRIGPASALPTINRTITIDGRTQAGWSSASCAPLVELDGSATAAGVPGLLVAASNSSIHSLVINRFGGNGITLAATTSGHTVSGNRIGTNPAGSTAQGNGGHGVELRAASSTIGGTGSCGGNLISGNSGSGLYVAASGATLTANTIGLNAAGSAALPNQHGIRSAGSSALTIGGATSAAVNRISGNSGHGLWFEGSNSAITAQGNSISGNGDRGVTLSGSSASQVNLQANAIWGNGSLGIDLGNDGVSSNTGAKDLTRPNAAMNHPLFGGAGVAADGLSMTVYGYVGTGSGQAVFAGARIEVYKAAADATGYGEGQVYLGSLTADANGQFSGSVTFSAGTVGVGDTITATATDGSGNTSEFGPTWTSTTVAALTPAGFDAFDTGTAAGSTSGALTTRIAGATSTLDVIALNSSGSGLHAGFTGTLSLTWLDARDDSGATSGSCRASWSAVGASGAAGSAAFTNGNRVTVSVVPPAAATRVMRLRMSYTNGLGTTTTACSGDAFAVIPASLTMVASDGDAASAGTTRLLANASASGGIVHRAGRAFTVTATARDALGNVMTGYSGTPTLAVAGCLLPAGCSAGTLSHTGTSAVAGVYSNSTVSYAEVGAISLQLSDTTYAAIDAADTALAARTIASAATTAGRFVPDSYALSVSANGTLATANAACLASGSGASFFGQGLGWTSAPQVTVTALNAAGSTTTLWAGALMKLDASAAVPTMATSGAGSATLASSLGSLTFAALGSGQARYAASATDRFVLDLPVGTMQVSTTPAWTWTLALTDASEAALSGNPTLTASVAQPGVPFDHGAVFHSGRLALAAAHGDARSGVRQLVQLQRWTSAGWVTMTEDRGCISLGPEHVAVSSGSGAFASNACAAPLGSTVTTQGGRAWLPLPATPAGAEGRLLTRLAGDSTGAACTSGGVTQAVANLNLPWLMAGGSGPTARATWGRANRDAVLRRETW